MWDDVDVAYDLPQTGLRTYSGETLTNDIANYSSQLEWTSDSGGVFTSITQFTLSYCTETITQQAAFERVG
jgi:hypothetical protein